MKVVVFGGSGLVGRYLKDKFETIYAVRDLAKVKTGTFYWDPITGELDPNDLEGVDAIINLCGDNIASFFWSEGKKRSLFESRIRATEIIVQTLKKMSNPPKYLFNASAVGYYGNRGDEILTEKSTPGKGFLASVCQKWEEAAKPVSSQTSVVYLRFGVLLSKDGGLLNRLLIPFNLCLGGNLGSGKQWMSWAALDEIAPIISHIYDKKLTGPVNIVAPNPVTNAEFTKTLAAILNRPAIMSIPATVLKTLFGEFADEMLLGSTRVVPEVLLQSGYSFKYPDLKSALTALLDKV